MQQRSHGRLLFALCTALIVPLAGCGGDSNNVYQVVTVKTTPPPGTSSANVGSAASTASFTTATGTSGTITLPPATSGSAPASFVTSTTPPAGIPTLSASSAARRVSDTSSGGILYVSATFASTITLPSLPAFSFSGISTTPNTSYFLAFFDPNVGTYAAAVEGPANINASGTVAFTAPAGSVTFTAGKTYVFALYGVSFSPIALNAGTLAITGLGSANAATLTASESAYTGAFTATSANPAIAAVSVSGATITVVPAAAGSTTVTVTDAHGQTATATVTVGLAPIALSTASVAITGVGNANAATLTASESKYAGAFTATSAAPSIATASAANGTVTIVPVAAGQTSVTIADAQGQTAVVTVTITLAPVTVDHATLSFTTLGAAGAQTFTPAEAHYGGTFSATSANPAVATVSGPNSSGAFTVTAVGGGTTAITVSDANHQTATVNASVTTGTFIPQ